MATRNFYNGELKQGIPQSIYNIGTIPINNIGRPSGIRSLINSIGNSNGIGVIGNAIGQVGGNLIGGGLESGAGNIIGGLGSIASAVPGPVGAIGSAALGIAGGLVNRAFGSKLNQENISLQEDAINKMNSATSDLSDFDSLSSVMSSSAGAANLSKSFYGKDGWFSNKAKNLAKKLNEQARIAGQRQDIAFINNAEDISSNQLGLLEANYIANGGKIHIKKKNRGKFTDYCGGKVTSECIQRGLHSSNPTTRKRANFARNARKWHSFGGWLNSQGGDFTNGVTFINNGGTHEENPFEGVQMGVDPQGVPNLVEQGEVVYNDYVFSNRMKVPKRIKEKYNIKGETFADAAKELSKESEERPNDPISQRGLDTFMSALTESQEEVRIKNEDRRMNKYAKGGKLGNLFEGPGEGPQYMSRAAAKRAGYSVDSDKTYTRIPLSTGRGGSENDDFNLSYLRYAPALMSGISAFSDLFSKPDYSAANRVASVDIQPALVSASPIGQYLAYRPMDRMFYINQLNKNAAAGRRAIQNTTGGNRAAALAGILAADYNYGENLGQMARQAEEYNQALRERTAAFNRATDMFNSQQSLQAQSTNAQSRNDATRMRLAQAEEVAKLRQAARNAYDARRSNNLNSFITNLGNIGWEEKQAEWLDNLAKRGVLLMNTSGEYTGGTRKNGGKLKKKRRTTYA